MTKFDIVGISDNFSTIMPETNYRKSNFGAWFLVILGAGLVIMAGNWVIKDRFMFGDRQNREPITSDSHPFIFWSVIVATKIAGIRIVRRGIIEFRKKAS